MSPEQAEGKNIDARSDIFSFGTVLYEMTTGRRPFQGRLDGRHIGEDSERGPDTACKLATSVPSDLEKIILRCLRKDPARRYQTMADLKIALEDVQAESSTGARVAAIAIADPLEVGGCDCRCVAAGCGFRKLAHFAQARSSRAASCRPAHHTTRSAALSLFFSRRQSRRVYLDRAQAGQP